MHLKSVIFERDNLQMELDDAFNQIEKLEAQVQVAVKAGGDEVLHTVMEIRQNPYEDLDEGEEGKDRTVQMVTSPFEDNNKVMQLSKKNAGGRSALDLGPMPPLNLPGAGALEQNAGGLSSAASQGNLKMNLGLHNKNIGNARAKKNIAKIGIPSLDLSTLKNVREFKDWYGYS